MDSVSELSSGIYVRGIVISNSASVFNRKDGSGKVVCLRHELAMQPGVVIWEKYVEANDGCLKWQGDELTDFPKMKEFEAITLKAKKIASIQDKTVVKDAEIVA